MGQALGCIFRFWKWWRKIKKFQIQITFLPPFHSFIQPFQLLSSLVVGSVRINLFFHYRTAEAKLKDCARKHSPTAISGHSSQSTKVGGRGRHRVQLWHLQQVCANGSQNVSQSPPHFTLRQCCGMFASLNANKRDHCNQGGSINGANPGLRSEDDRWEDAHEIERCMQEVNIAVLYVVPFGDSIPSVSSSDTQLRHKGNCLQAIC